MADTGTSQSQSGQGAALNPNSGAPSYFPKQPATASLMPNCDGRIYTQACPPPSTDLSDVPAYVESVKLSEIRAESQRLLEELGRSSGDQALRIKAALDGLLEKATDAGMRTKEIPELAGRAAIYYAAYSGLFGHGRPRGSGGRGAVIRSRLRPKINTQKQSRHIKGSAPRDKSYLNSNSDAQKVLDAVRNGDAKIISMDLSQNSMVVEVPQVEGTYVNVGNPNGLPDVAKPTHTFMIQGGDKVVPVNPGKGM